ncbi:MAG: alpha/beta hydrolase [Planctomycetota bacterium]
MRSRTGFAFFVSCLIFLNICTMGQEKKKGPPIPPGVKVERDIIYGKGGETDLKLDLYLPEKKNGAAIVVIHGGGWKGGDKGPFGGAAVHYAAQGYVAVSINYRLSDVAKFPAAVEDCKCAVRWLRAHAKEYGFDPNKMGATGNSAGAHLSLMLGLTKPEDGLDGTGGNNDVSSAVQVVVSQAGPTQFVPSWRHPAVQGFLGGFADEVPDVAKKASPITYVRKDAPPILMLHGTSDKTVPHTQVIEMEKALKDAGATFELISIEGGGHGVFEKTPPEERQKVVQRLDDFFAKHLAVTPVPQSKGPQQ